MSQRYYCSFCGKAQDQVRKLIAGPGTVFICNECVELCMEIIQTDRAVDGEPEYASWDLTVVQPSFVETLAESLIDALKRRGVTLSQ